jgi:SAM-dependent methyltransferase
MANEAEIRRWNDQRWTTAWPGRDALTTSVTPQLVTSLTLNPGQRVLDIGCGGGGLAVALAGAVAPGGHVVGVDVSEALLNLARQRADEMGITNLDLVLLDMQSGAVGGEPFSLVVSQFGVMFFDEPVVAFTNIARHLQPGGVLTFACWQTVDHNPWHIGAAMSRLVGPPPSPVAGKSATGPFTLGDVDWTTGLLAEAGFSETRVDPRQLTVTAPATAVVDVGLLEFMGVPPERMDEAFDVIEQHLVQFRVAEDAYNFPLAFQIVTARRSDG